MKAQIGSLDEQKKKTWRDKQKHKDEEEDQFGKRDEDWEVYKNLSKDGHQEDEEEIKQKLNEINEKIGDVDEDYKCLYMN